MWMVNFPILPLEVLPDHMKWSILDTYALLRGVLVEIIHVDS